MIRGDKGWSWGASHRPGVIANTVKCRECDGRTGAGVPIDPMKNRSYR